MDREFEQYLADACVSGVMKRSHSRKAGMIILCRNDDLVATASIFDIVEHEPH